MLHFTSLWKKNTATLLKAFHFFVEDKNKEVDNTGEVTVGYYGTFNVWTNLD